MHFSSHRCCRADRADESAGAEPCAKVPDGFSIELAAGPPLVERPIVAAFDDDGRLYVAESSGSNDPVQKQLEEKPHRIVRLEDTDGDGKFDRRTVFADQMMFPEGAMFFDGSLYVSAPPSIWKLTDHRRRRRRRRARRMVPGQNAHRLRERFARPVCRPRWLDLLVQRRVRRADAHGQRPRMEDEGRPHLSLPAGWHRLRAGDDRRHGQSGRCRVHAGRRTHPVGHVFSSLMPRHDGLVHAIYGGVYGKEHGVLDGHPRTGELMPVLDPDEPRRRLRAGAL